MANKLVMRFIFITAAIYLYWQAKKKKQDKSLPPIAPGYLPIVGHLFSIFKRKAPHDIFNQWSKQVGPIYTVYFGSQRWIILNSYDVIKDLIIDRGAVYSSRNLPITVTEDFCQGEEGGAFAFYGYTDNWRRLRRIAHNGLTKNRINKYLPLIDASRNTLLLHLHELAKKQENATTGVSLENVFEHYAVINIVTILYGSMYNFQPGDPQLHDMFRLTTELLKSVTPADQLRAFFPVLEKIWPAKREKYLKLREEYISFHSSMLKKFRDKHNEDPNSVEDCFIKEVIESGSLTDLEIQYFIGVFVAAAAETTVATLSWIVAFLTNHPEIQDRAYEEIKNAVGTERLPNTDDEHLLPYVQCIILEILRIRPPAPCSLPHANSKDNAYKNWLIPKDTVIILNLFSANHDSSRFSEPEKFIPDRHMDYVLANKHSGQPKKDYPHLAFSAGRRICVGSNLAETSLFLATVTLIACYKFESPSGTPVDINSQRSIRETGLMPVPYNTRLVPRHNHISSFIY